MNFTAHKYLLNYKHQNIALYLLCLITINTYNYNYNFKNKEINLLI